MRTRVISTAAATGNTAAAAAGAGLTVADFVDSNSGVVVFVVPGSVRKPMWLGAAWGSAPSEELE